MATMLLLGGLTAACPGNAGTGNVDPQTIQQRIKQLLSVAVADAYPHGEFEITPLPVASAIKSRTCEQMQFEPPAGQLFGRVSVRVSCRNPVPWGMYAQAQVDLQLPVVVARRTLQRQERISAADVSVELMPASQIRTNSLTRTAEAIGKSVRSTVRSGQVLSERSVVTPLAVSRGERVRIESSAGRVQIQTAGVALQEGRIGDQIPVRNDASKRTIHPWVIAPGVVGTRPP